MNTTRDAFWKNDSEREKRKMCFWIGFTCKTRKVDSVINIKKCILKSSVRSGHTSGRWTWSKQNWTTQMSTAICVTWSQGTTTAWTGGKSSVKKEKKWGRKISNMENKNLFDGEGNRITREWYKRGGMIRKRGKIRQIERGAVVQLFGPPRENRGKLKSSLIS